MVRTVSFTRAPRVRRDLPKVTIKIPRPLYNSLKQLIEHSGFNSVNDFVVYVLRDVVSNSTINKVTPLTTDEIDTIKSRLKNLGYLS